MKKILRWIKRLYSIDDEMRVPYHPIPILPEMYDDLLVLQKKDKSDSLGMLVNRALSFYGFYVDKAINEGGLPAIYYYGGDIDTHYPQIMMGDHLHSLLVDARNNPTPPENPLRRVK